MVDVQAGVVSFTLNENANDIRYLGSIGTLLMLRKAWQATYFILTMLSTTYSQNSLLYLTYSLRRSLVGLIPWLSSSSSLSRS